MCVLDPIDCEMMTASQSDLLEHEIYATPERYVSQSKEMSSRARSL